MKKIISILLLILFITGCNLSNTPIAKTEEYLNKYQMLDKSIDTSYTNLTNNTNLTSNEQKRYEKLIKKQYRNLVYEIKEESINGTTATVPVKIKVINYKKIIDKYNNKEVLTKLQNTKEKITYTINFTLTKKHDTWIINNLSKEDKLKLLGIK